MEKERFQLKVMTDCSLQQILIATTDMISDEQIQDLTLNQNKPTVPFVANSSFRQVYPQFVNILSIFI